MTKVDLRKLEAEAANPARLKHGVYGYLTTGAVPMPIASSRSAKRALRYVRDLYRRIHDRLGGDAIPPEVEALVGAAHHARTISELGMTYVKKAGIMRRDSIRRGDLELHSVLSRQLVAYANLERLNLMAAFELAGRKNSAPTPGELIVIGDSEAEDRARIAPGGRSDEGQAETDGTNVPPAGDSGDGGEK
jgi:hypothetical protein